MRNSANIPADPNGQQPSNAQPIPLGEKIIQILQSPQQLSDRTFGEVSVNFASVGEQILAILPSDFQPQLLPDVRLFIRDTLKIPLMAKEYSDEIASKLKDIFSTSNFSATNRESYNAIFSNPICAMILGPTILEPIIFSVARPIDSLEIKTIIRIFEQNLEPKAIEGICSELTRSLMLRFPTLQSQHDIEVFDLYAQGLPEESFQNTRLAPYTKQHAQYIADYIISPCPKLLGQQITLLLERTVGKDVFEFVDIKKFSYWLSIQLDFHLTKLKEFAEAPQDKQVEYSDIGSTRLENFAETINFLIFASEDFPAFRNTHIDHVSENNKSRWLPKKMAQCVEEVLHIIQCPQAMIEVDPLLPGHLRSLFDQMLVFPDDYIKKFYSVSLPSAINTYAENGNLRGCCDLSTLFPQDIPLPLMHKGQLFSELLSDYVSENSASLLIALRKKSSELGKWISSDLGRSLIHSDYGYENLQGDLRSVSDFLRIFFKANSFLLSTEALDGLARLSYGLLFIDDIRRPTYRRDSADLRIEYMNGLRCFYQLLECLPESKDTFFDSEKSATESQAAYLIARVLERFPSFAKALSNTFCFINQLADSYLKEGNVRAFHEGEIFENELEMVSTLYKIIPTKYKEDIFQPTSVLELRELSRRGRGIREFLFLNNDLLKSWGSTRFQYDLDRANSVALIERTKIGTSTGNLFEGWNFSDHLRAGTIKISAATVDLSFERKLAYGENNLRNFSHLDRNDTQLLRKVFFLAEEYLFCSLILATKDFSADKLSRAISALDKLYKWTPIIQNPHSLIEVKRTLPISQELQSFLEEMSAILSEEKKQGETSTSTTERNKSLVLQSLLKLKHSPNFSALLCELGLQEEG